ncbi:MAG: hypothetical protein MI867_11260 [Pseudomonadales bacterium]|nr:hypothetical protein [Pseudomonadales bacterium]
MNKKLLSTSIAVILATSLGCGGGGGGSSNDDDDDDPSTTLSGTASKGIIQLGLVTAYELDSTGTQVRSVGSDTTDSSGDYSIALSSDYAGGPIQLVITATTDTRMTCDALDGCNGGSDAFGADITLPDGFTMNAIVPPQSGGSVSTQITPLSHMAAARALAADTVNEEAVDNAISEINQLVGVNILTTDIVDITDPTALASASDDAKQFALFGAGIADIVLNEGSGVNEQLEALADSFEDGQFQGDDDITITTILNSVNEATTDAGNNDDINTALEDAIEDVERVIEIVNTQVEGGNYNPEPGSNAGATEVAQVKALISDTRTFLDTIVENYESPIDAFDIDLRAAEEVLSEDSTAVIDIAGEALNQALDDLGERGITLGDELENPGTYETSILNDSDQSIGTVTSAFSADTNGIAITFNGTLDADGDTTVSITNLRLLISFSDDDLSVDESDTVTSVVVGTEEALTLTGTVANNAGTSVTFNDVAVTVTSSSGSTVEPGNTSSEETTTDNITGVSFNGDVTIQADGASFNGDLETELVAFSEGVEAEEDASIAGVGISGTFTSDTGSFEADASVTIDNAADIDVFTYLEEDAETENEFVEALVILSTELDTPDLDEANVVVTFDRTGLEEGELTVDIISGGETYTIEANNEDEEETVTLSNPDGVTIEVELEDEDDISGAAFVGDTQVGTIETTDNDVTLIRYNDGTFESLF